MVTLFFFWTFKVTSNWVGFTFWFRDGVLFQWNNNVYPLSDRDSFWKHSYFLLLSSFDFVVMCFENICISLSSFYFVVMCLKKISYLFKKKRFLPYVFKAFDFINPLPHVDDFWRLCSWRLLQTLWKHDYQQIHLLPQCLVKHSLFEHFYILPWSFQSLL